MVFQRSARGSSNLWLSEMSSSNHFIFSVKELRFKESNQKPLLPADMSNMSLDCVSLTSCIYRLSWGYLESMDTGILGDFKPATGFSNINLFVPLGRNVWCTFRLLNSNKFGKGYNWIFKFLNWIVLTVCLLPGSKNLFFSTISVKKIDAKQISLFLDIQV